MFMVCEGALSLVFLGLFEAHHQCPQTLVALSDDFERKSRDASSSHVSTSTGEKRKNGRHTGACVCDYTLPPTPVGQSAVVESMHHYHPHMCTCIGRAGTTRYYHDYALLAVDEDRNIFLNLLRQFQDLPFVTGIRLTDTEQSLADGVWNKVVYAKNNVLVPWLTAGRLRMHVGACQE